MTWAILALALALVVLGLIVLGYVLTSTGRLTADTGWGRRVRPLGPQVVLIRASRDVVFDLASVPYLSANPPRELRERIEVLERGTDMVLAAHRTQAGPFTTVTVETVTFERPERIAFRLVRGPVPTVTERFRAPRGGRRCLDGTRVRGGARDRRVCARGPVGADRGRVLGANRRALARRPEGTGGADVRTQGAARASARETVSRTRHHVRPRRWICPLADALGTVESRSLPCRHVHAPTPDRDVTEP